MKVLGLVFGIALFSCNQPSEIEDRRGSFSAERQSEVPQSQQGVVVDDTLLSYAEISLQATPGSDALSSGEFNNILLASRIDETTTVLIGKDGISKIYGGEDGVVEVLPKITPPSDRQLLTLDSEDFWIVGSEQVSKRKDTVEGGDPDQVILHNFNISLLSGDRSNIEILGATKNALILNLTTHIAIFKVKNGITTTLEFKAVLPTGAPGNVISAGETAGGGIWFYTDENRLAFLVDNGGKWSWTLGEVAVSEVGAIRLMGAWIDQEQKSAIGEVIAITDTSIFSISAAPLTAPET